MTEVLTFQAGDTRVAERIIDRPDRWPTWFSLRDSVLHLPEGILMSPGNAGPDVMDMLVLKTPHPEARP